MKTLPETNSSPLKIGLPNRGYVGFSEDTISTGAGFLPKYL